MGQPVGAHRPAHPNGPHLKHLKDQLARLAAATVRMGLVEDGRAVQVNAQLVSAFDL